MGRIVKALTLLLAMLFLLSTVVSQFVIVNAQSNADQAWNIQVIDSDKNGGVGLGSSLVLDSADNPHISYTDSQLRLKYAVWTGFSWSIQTVDTDVGTTYTALALDSKGNPHILYSKSERGSDLMYASWTGSSWDIQAVYVNLADTIYEFSFALDSRDHPYVSYFDSTSNEIKIVSNIGSGWKTQTVSSIKGSVYVTSLALDSEGKPHVAYQDIITLGYTSRYEPIHQAFFKYAEWTGNEWTIETIEDLQSNQIGYGLSLTLSSKGYPYFSYFDQYGSLRYAYWNGNNWNFWQITNSNPDSDSAFGTTSMCLDASDYPHICYRIDYNTLSYTAWTGFKWNTQTLHETNTISYVSLSLDHNGNPHISYFDNDLKYAVLASVSPLGELFIITIIAAVSALIVITLIVVTHRKNKLRRSRNLD